MVKRIAGIFCTLSFGVATVMVAALVSGCGGSANSVAPLPQTASNDNGNSQPMVYLSSAQITEKTSYTDFRYHLTPIAAPGSIVHAMSVHPMSVVYPDDMTKGSGKVLTATTQNDIYVNTTAAAVGSPATFQADYNLSTFIGVLNQYDGDSTSTGKFPVGTAFTATPLTIYSNVISDNQLFGIIHAAAKTGGTGYGHEYHVFLENGLDTCMDFGPCYSPDNPATFVFCAYHGSVTFTDIGHVIYSIMPYQDVPGCGDNGLAGDTVANSTATTLSHETAESISDPDPNTGWFNAAVGSEIADVCAGYRATETLNKVAFIIQPIYSNAVHGCFY